MYIKNSDRKIHAIVRIHIDQISGERSRSKIIFRKIGDDVNKK